MKSYGFLIAKCRFIAFYCILLINADISKYNNCTISNKQLKFPILPGMGWDNLENREMGKILSFKFSMCKFSDDNKYLIPDEVSIYPKRSSEVDLYSESFDHFMNYSSTTSKSMKFETEILMILGGQFSDENEQVKSYQLETKSKIIRVQMRYNFYRALLEPDTPLHPNFMYRITKLADWIKSYNETFYSSYLADMIIRDFGTHVIRSVDAGATLSKVDFLSSNYVRKMNSKGINIEAFSTASFLNHFKLDMNIKNNDNLGYINNYNRNCEKTILKSYGGFRIGTDINLDKWVASLDENFVAIDRRGDLIYHILNKKVLPHLSNDIIHKVSNILMESVERYYNANSRKGCMDMNSPNFNSDANIDSGNCIKPVVYFSFGGVYSTCSGPNDQCGRVSRPNPLTGSYSCPDGFASVLLNEGLNECREYCNRGWFSSNYETKCSNFQLYWCYPLTNSPNHNGYHFGGFIDSQTPTCPIGFFPINFVDATQLCVTNDASVNKPSAIEFGGFYSCKIGNPLAVPFFKDRKSNILRDHVNSKEKWLYNCPDGYVAHLATINRNCQISYCTESNKVTLGNLPNLKRPPFFKVSFTSNGTTSKILYYKNGEMFINNFNFNSFSKLYANKNANSFYGILFGCSLVVLIILLASFIVCYRKRMQLKKIKRNYQILNKQSKRMQLNENCYVNN